MARWVSSGWIFLGLGNKMVRSIANHELRSIFGVENDDPSLGMIEALGKPDGGFHRL